jgi:rubrerythrin
MSVESFDSRIERLTEDIYRRLNREDKLYPTPNLGVARLVSEALKSENDAIGIYLDILQYISDPDVISDIQEIISDEENHKIKLEKIMKKYNRIPAAKS